MSSPPIRQRMRWVDADHVEVDGVPFAVKEWPTDEPLLVWKPRPMFEDYLDVIDEFSGSRVVELGIYRGGSTAFFAHALRPEQLSAIELAAEPVAELDRFLDAHGLRETITLHYGTDQGDRARIADIVREDFDGQALDLVIDDASHYFGPTRASFEVLFPRLRPGGLYVIEDWCPEQPWLRMFAHELRERSGTNEHLESGLAAALRGPRTPWIALMEQWFTRAMRDDSSPDHLAVSSWFDELGAAPPTPERDILLGALGEAMDRSGTDEASEERPLLALAAEMLIACAASPTVVGGVSVTPHWLTVRRGEGEIDPDRFALGDAAHDRLGILRRPR